MGSVLSEQHVLSGRTQDMADGDMAFLYARYVGRRDIDAELAQVGYLSAGSTGQADRCDTEFVGDVQCAHDIGRVARGRDRDEYILGFCMGLELPAEQRFIPIIITDCGEYRGVGGQRYGRQGGAIESEAADQFCGDMLRIGRAAAISGEQYFAAILIAVDDKVGDRFDLGEQLDIGQHGFLHCDGFADLLGYEVTRKLGHWRYLERRFHAVGDDAILA